MKAESELITLKSALVNKYSKADGLYTEQLNSLLKLQYKARWYKMSRYMSVALLMIALSGASLLVWNNYQTQNSFDTLALAALDHHNQHADYTIHASHQKSIHFSEVQSHFQSFDLVALDSLNLSNTKILSYIKCKLVNVEAIHLVIQNKQSGAVESLFQLPYNEESKNALNINFKSDNNYQYVKDDMNIDVALHDQTIIIATKKSIGF